MKIKMKKILLDTFCKAGGCSVGYHRAGFDIVGVDHEPQPNYPFEFFQGDALEFIFKHGKEFDVIHASPPCQGYSRSTYQFRKGGKVYPDLIKPTRELLVFTGKPYIIENVPGSPLIPDVKLCGEMFNLKVIRWRWFELGGGLFIMNPGKPQIKKNMVTNGERVSVFGNGNYRKSKNDAHPIFKQGSVKATWGYAMGIDWMTVLELREAIPPAYTQFIGENIYDQV
jgi:DNA (cytosine-5)-methyltransferase 1